MIFSRFSLKYRIALSIFVLEAVMILSVLSQTQAMTRDLTQQIQDRNDQAMVDLLTDLSRVALFTVDFGELQQYIERVAGTPHVDKILVADESGRVVISSEFSNLGKAVPPLENSAESFWRRSEIRHLGQMAVKFSNQELIDATDQVQRLGYTIALGGMLIIAIAGVLFGFVLTRRLEVLASTSSRFARGDFYARCSMPGGDEVARLGHTFDQMADTLTEHIQQLQLQKRELQDAHDVLEACVAERTRDLVDKNLKLESTQLQLQQEKAEQARLIEQLTEAQDQMIQSEKMAAIGRLAAGVAHEINTPIGYVKSNVASLQGYSQDLMTLIHAYETMEGALGDQPGYPALAALKRRIDPDFLQQDIVDLIDESQQGLVRVKDIVQDLKDFSRVNNRSWQLADMHQCLDSTLNIARSELKDGVKIIKAYDDRLPEVECLPHQLNQVFMNLLLNAAQAIDGQGEIRLSTRLEGEKVRIEVVDNGCGIAEEHQDKIFDPFFTTKPVGSGTGLGLSTSYRIIQQHRGEILVQSRIGEGARFQVELPIYQR